MERISRVLTWCQRSLFPALEDEFGQLNEAHRKLVRVIEIVAIEDHVPRWFHGTRGRPLQNRSAIARAFIAKAILKLPDTRSLIDYLHASSTVRRICGWNRRGEIPSESTFSRAFAEFAESSLPECLHEQVIEETYEDRIVGHISRDSTDIEAREKPARKPPKKKKTTKKVGRPKKGDVRPQKEPTRLERQVSMTLDEMLADLPTVCDVGSKSNSKGRKCFWAGYRFHVDFADGEVPISCVLTSASVHDSQAALPLSVISSQRVLSLYDLMDAAYDMGPIHDQCSALGHVAIIDHNPRRGGKKRQMDPARAQRYNIRSTAERGFSRLKDSFGARSIRVRGHSKVFAHLMFGILALTIDQITNALA